MTGAPDDDAPLGFRDATRLRLALLRARRRTRLTQAQELEILRLISLGNRDAAEAIVREAFALALDRELIVLRARGR